MEVNWGDACFYTRQQSQCKPKNNSSNMREKIEDSDSQSFVDNLEIDRKDFDFAAANKTKQQMEQNRKKPGWLSQEQQDIDRFIFGDTTKRSKQQKAKKEALEARKQQRQAKRKQKQQQKLKKAKERLIKREQSQHSLKSSKKSAFSQQRKRDLDIQSIGKISNASVCWIRDDEFDDGINWSDDEQDRPNEPHQSFFSNGGHSIVKQSPKMAVKQYKSPQFLDQNISLDAFSRKSSIHSFPSQIRTKRSYTCKQPSIQLFSNWQELPQIDDDHRWFAQIKREQPTLQQKERYKQEQMKQRKEYEQYKRRLYRKKRMSQTRKVFQRSQLEQLREKFQIFHNQEGQEEENGNNNKPKRQIIGLPKTTLQQLAHTYASSVATINNLYRQWRFDPTLSKTLARFDRVFTLGWGQKPQRPIFARQRTQKRIQTLSRLIQENPFMTQQQMCASLEQSQQYMEKIQRSGLLRVLRMGDFRRKRLKLYHGDANCPDSLVQRASFTLRLRNYLSRGFQVYFYDQMLISQYYDCQFGWTRAQKDVVHRSELLIHESIVILGMLSATGDLLWDARFGDYSFSQLDEVMRGFIAAVDKKRGPCKKLLAINTLTHRDTKTLAHYFQQRGWETIFIPTHGLQLNPLFNLYTTLRSHLCRKKTRNFQALFQQVVNYLRQSEKRCLGVNFLQRIEVYMKRAEQQQHF